MKTASHFSPAHDVKQPISFPRRIFAPGVLQLCFTHPESRGGRSAEKRSGACEAPVGPAPPRLAPHSGSSLEHALNERGWEALSIASIRSQWINSFCSQKKSARPPARRSTRPGPTDDPPAALFPDKRLFSLRPVRGNGRELLTVSPGPATLLWL